MSIWIPPRTGWNLPRAITWSMAAAPSAADRSLEAAHTPSGSPAKLYQQFASSVCDDGLALEQVLPCLTYNTARALKLARKGQIALEMDADVLRLTNNLQLTPRFRLRPTAHARWADSPALD